MKTKNSPPSSHFAPEDRCPNCGSLCDVEKDMDEKDYCNDCRPKQKIKQAPDYGTPSTRNRK